jgi:hypothetical protein
MRRHGLSSLPLGAERGSKIGPNNEREARENGLRLKAQVAPGGDPPESELGTRQFDPLLTFKMGPVNVREGQESGRRL